ncbi:MAG TPA: hypothetical protein PLQ81_08250, partial [bacterium]|nr:hypothetical protein [bacterium]
MNTSKLVAVLFLMIFFLYSLPICSGDSNNSELKKFNEIFNEDLKKIKQYRAGLNEITGFLRKSDIISPKPKNYMFSLDERILLKNLWGACLDYNSALNSIRKNYQIEFFKKKEGEKIKKFLMNYSVFLAQYRFALDFIGILDSNKNIDTLLNESVVESGVEENSFADFKFEFLNVMKAAQFAAYEFIYKEFYNKRICSELEILINEDSKYIWKSGKGKGGKLTLKNAFKIIVDAGHKIWLPVQQESANIMSEIKVYRKDANLITKEQIQSVIGKINPGDILFERREWYLTNIGIPGYWT